MILVADSGSTKTDWCCIRKNGDFEELTTLGLNPNSTDKNEIYQIIEGLPFKKGDIQQIYFYGAGCGILENARSIELSLGKSFRKSNIEVNTDLLGAARACLQKDKGIIAILGTGSNSGYYNGAYIEESLPSLGYILGDLGSGVDIGKEILRDYFYKKIPDHIGQEIQLSRSQLIHRLYKESGPNTFIASHAGLVFKFQDDPYINQLIKKVFNRFIEQEIMSYQQSKELSINFVGSIAFLFQNILESKLKKNGLSLGKVIQNPIDILKEFHYSDALK